MFVQSVTIANTETESSVINCAAFEFDPIAVLVKCPATLPSITLLTLQGSETGETGTFTDIQTDVGDKVTCVVAAGIFVSIPPSRLAVLPPYLRLKANAAASAARTFNLYFRRV